MSENTQANAIYAPNELSRILPSHEVLMKLLPNRRRWSTARA